MRDGTTIVVDLRCDSEKWAFYSGRYDYELISEIHRLFDKDKCFLDVGANIGFYAVSVAAFVRANESRGKVVAFEPFAPNYKRLVDNIGINALGEYCITHEIGLSDTAAECDITLREDFTHGSQTGNAAIPTNEEFDKGFGRSRIKLVRLDDIWSTESPSALPIDMIKIDIKRHEDFFLRGAKNIVFGQRPTILMEVNKPYYRA